MSTDSLNLLDSSESQIKDFFDKLNLSVSLSDPFINEYFWLLFSHIKYPISFNIDDVKNNVKNCWEYYKGTKCSANMIEKLISSNNSIDNVFHVFSPTEDTKRSDGAFIHSLYGTVFSGCNHELINTNRIQNWVNIYHNYQFEHIEDKLFCGFILFLLYMRIMPHSDYNEQVANYLFLSNKLSNVCIPLYEVINSGLIEPEHELTLIYKWLYNDSSTEDLTKEVDYYTLEIPNEIVKRIYYLIYISILYSTGMKNIHGFNAKVNKNKDFDRLFCECRGNFPIFISHHVKISEERRINNIRFTHWLNDKLMAWSIHQRWIVDVMSIRNP